jgi:hypothetical protein
MRCGRKGAYVVVALAFLATVLPACSSRPHEPTLDVHAAALRAAGGPSDTIADVQCPSPVQRPTGDTVLCTVITKVPLDPAEVAVRVVDAGSGRVDSAFISGDRDCSAYANWADTLLRQSGTPCAVIDSGLAATGPAVDVDIRTMHVGQCYNGAMDPDQGSITSCTDSHDGEVIGTIPVQGALPDAQASADCRPLLSPQLADHVDQDVLSLTWSQPTASTNALTCRLERGTHEAPLEQPVGSG